MSQESAKLATSKGGFSLIELMIVVAILGVLAAIALPTMAMHTKRTKTSEAFTNLKSLYVNANAYFVQERTDARDGTGNMGHCIVDATAATIPATPSPTSAAADFSADPSFAAIGFLVSDPVRYGYGIDSPGSSCGVGGASANVYTFFAEGDLDGDTTLSRFELAVGTKASGEMYRSPGIYTVDELE